MFGEPKGMKGNQAMISVQGVARAAVVAAMVVLAAGAVQATPITIDTVPVSDAGNAGEWSGESYGGWGPDRVDGAVAYEYNIGKYEVTAGQYTAFLNAVAATDTYGLYSTGMDPASYSYACNILRSNSSGSYTYSVVDGWADRPVNCVSWGDAARFANWLHNGQPTGAQSAGTTEDGAYYLNGATTAEDLMAVTRKAGATWAITSEEEWYKAAYYDPATGTYFYYPTSSNTAPGRDMADPLPGNNANYDLSQGLPIDSGKYTTVAGEFQNSDSPYGTFDQGGNVWEWNEAVIGSSRGVRGGAFLYAYYTLASDMRLDSNPVAEGGSMGFRVSEVFGPMAEPIPEPVTMAMVGMGIAGLGGYIRRRMAR